MLKYLDTKETFAEVPDEISLCINISNCPCFCKGCHSSYLSQDKGDILDKKALRSLISDHDGITCIAFMGGDAEPESVSALASYIKSNYSLKVCWYSGREILSNKINLKYFDYIKLGPYIEERGPLDNPNTNQKFYILVHNPLIGTIKLINSTYKFIKHDYYNR